MDPFASFFRRHLGDGDNDEDDRGDSGDEEGGLETEGEESPKGATAADEANEDNTKADFAAYIAMVFALAAFLPASYTIIKRGSSCDVSLVGVTMRLIAVIFWLYYAIVNRFVPNMVSSSVSLLFTLAFLCLVLFYGPYWPGARVRCPPRVAPGGNLYPGKFAIAQPPVL